MVRACRAVPSSEVLPFSILREKSDQIEQIFCHSLGFFKTIEREREITLFSIEQFRGTSPHLNSGLSPMGPRGVIRQLDGPELVFWARFEQHSFPLIVIVIMQADLHN